MQMQAPRETKVSLGLRPVPPPKLIIEREAWAKVFLRNLKDTLWPRSVPTQMLTAKPAPFWPDVFVSGGIPRRTLSLSALYHVALVVVLWALSSTFVFQTPMRPDGFFKHQQITYYDTSEYLPPIDTGSPPAKEAKKGEPEYSKQPIISLPPIPDNSTQTIIDPLHPEQLKQEQRLPNMMVWTQTPAPPVPGREVAKLVLPQLPGVIAPAVQSPARDLSQLNTSKLRPEAVAPAVEASNPELAKLPVVASPGAVQPVADAGTRSLGDLNVGRSDLVTTNPALPVPEQRAANLVSGTAKEALGGAGAVPPGPSVDSGGGAGLAAQGQFVALSVRPAPPNGPIDAPAGNRRGIFAATPEGRPGAPGTPDLAGEGTGNGGGGHGTGPAGTGSGNGSGMPAGITVGGMPGGPASGGAVVAAVTPPARPAPGVPLTGDALRRALNAAAAPKSVADIARETPRLPDGPSRIEDKVFGAKKYYSMILNMPNLTSAGGSWIIRFAELRGTEAPGELTAPVATSKVDPAYPPELIRKNVEGTVALYAVIHADGTVGEIRVLESVDDKLDANARAALAHWHFRPATKNGNAVDLEAVVFIPFKIRKTSF